MSKAEWSLFKWQHSIRNIIHQIFGYPWWLSEDIEGILVTLVFLAHLLVIGTAIWVLHKWIMIRLGKDALTNYRHYQKEFIDNNANTPYRISNNIFEYPHYLHDRKKLIRQCLVTALMILAIIKYAIHIAPNLSDFFYLIYHQLSDHRYTNKAFFRFIVQDIWAIIAPIVILVIVFIAITFSLKVINALYDKTNLLFKTRTRITTKIRRTKKVRYEKSDI